MDNAARLWKDATPEMKLVYQSMIFPEGVTYNFYDKILRTPVLSPLHFSHNTKTTLPVKEESLVVSHVDITWNSFLPYLIQLTDKLEALGFRYVDNKVIVLQEKADEK